MNSRQKTPVKPKDAKAIYNFLSRILAPEEMSEHMRKKLVSLGLECTVFPKKCGLHERKIKALVSLTIERIKGKRSISLPMLKHSSCEQKAKTLENLLVETFTRNGYVNLLSECTQPVKKAYNTFLALLLELKRDQPGFFSESEWSVFLPLIKHKQLIVIWDEAEWSLAHEFTHFFLTNASPKKTMDADFFPSLIELLFFPRGSMIYHHQELVLTTVLAFNSRQERSFYLPQAFSQEEGLITCYWAVRLYRLIRDYSQRIPTQLRDAFILTVVHRLANTFYYEREESLISILKSAEEETKHGRALDISVSKQD